jgi:hypothetical protein
MLLRCCVSKMWWVIPASIYIYMYICMYIKNSYWYKNIDVIELICLIFHDRDNWNYNKGNLVTLFQLGKAECLLQSTSWASDQLKTLCSPSMLWFNIWGDCRQNKYRENANQVSWLLKEWQICIFSFMCIFKGQPQHCVREWEYTLKWMLVN